MRPKQSIYRGFTLVELLVVMAIVSILTSLCILGFKSLTGSTGLTGASDQMTEILAFARQEAIAKDTMTAAVLITSSNVGNNVYRTISVWELVMPVDGSAPTSSNWVQASKWRTLPSGVVVDNSTVSSTLVSTYLTPRSSGTLVSPALPSMNYLGTSLNPASSTDCAVQLFLPSGRLSLPPTDPCTLQLVEGFYTGTTLTYQHPNATNPALPANYVSYYFSTATGEPKIVRP